MQATFYILLFKSFCFFLFFLLSVVSDFRKKSLSGALLKLFFIVGLPFFLFSAWHDFFQTSFVFSLPFLYSFYPLLFSIFMLIFSKWSKGALGEGDAYFLLCSALYMNYMSFFFFFLSALLSSAIVSILLYLLHKKKKKNLKELSFPFIPCFIPGALYLFVHILSF